MSEASRLVVVVFVAAFLSCGLSAEEAEHQVTVAFLHFDGESVIFELDGETVFDRVLTTQDHSVGLSHVETLALKMDSTIKWTVDGQKYEQQLEIGPGIGVIYITNGQSQAYLQEGDDLLLD